ncbi:hypothetical protein [Photobacterium damselae]|uniref:hypothetical protein n=1 Tax=Photobacterium damselae TaxID=38293 RepID=UPI004067AC45
MDKQRREGIKRIEKKIEILEKWLNTEIPFVLTSKGNRELDKQGKFELEHIPMSISALRNWNGSKNSRSTVEKYGIPEKTTSTKTWEAAPEYLRERVTGTKTIDNLFVRLKKKSLIQRDSGRISQIRELEEKLAIAKQDHAGIAHEMIGLRLENNTLTEELYITKQKVEGLKLQHNTEIDWRNRLAKQQKERITELEKEKDILLKQLLNISEKTGIYPDQLVPETNVITLERGDK